MSTYFPLAKSAVVPLLPSALLSVGPALLGKQACAASPPLAPGCIYVGASRKRSKPLGKCLRYKRPEVMTTMRRD